MELMTYGTLFASHGNLPSVSEVPTPTVTAKREERPLSAPPSPTVAVPVFQRMYCWSEEEVRAWWRDAVMGNGHAALKVKGGHATGRCLFRLVAEDGGEGVGDGGVLLCLDGQQRCTTMLLALAAIRDAALRLVPRPLGGGGVPSDRPLSQAEAAAMCVVERVDRALYRDVEGARRWIHDVAAAAALDQSRGCAAASTNEHAAATYAEGAFPSFATTLLPSFVDRAPFLECITAGAVAHALMDGTPKAETSVEVCGAVMPTSKLSLGEVGDGGGGAGARGASASYAGYPSQSTALAATPLGRAKRILDDAAAALLHPLAAAPARLAAAAEAALNRTRLIYIEVGGADVDLAQAFQWLQEKTLLAAGAILWNPRPGVEFSACDLARNAMMSSFLRLSLTEQEKVYREVWLDPLQRRIKGGGGPVVFDELLRAFLDGEDGRRAAAGAAAPAALRKKGAGSLTVVAGFANAAAVDGILPMGPRHVSATEHDLAALMASDQVPDRLKQQLGPGSPMNVYVRFRSYVEEVALGLQGKLGNSGTDGGGVSTQVTGNTAVGTRGANMKFDFTSSAPPPPLKEAEEEDETGTDGTCGPQRGDGRDTEGAWAREVPVMITEQACRVVVGRLVQFAARTGRLVE